MDGWLGFRSAVASDTPARADITIAGLD